MDAKKKEEILEMAKKFGYWSGETIEMNDVGVEQFAEHIIKQCAELVEDFYTEHSYHIAGIVIKSHFGV